MIALAFAVSKEDLKEAEKIEQAYFEEQKDRENRYKTLLAAKEKQIKEYVDSLSKEKLKEELYKRLLNLERDRIYDEVYGDDEFFEEPEYFEDY